MREAGELATRVMNRALAKLAPGVRQHEVAADIYHEQITGLDGKYGDYTSLCPLIQVAEGTSTPHLTWTDEPLPDEGLVVIELAAARRHYHAPLVRTAYIGSPPPEVSKLASAIVEGWRQGYRGGQDPERPVRKWKRSGRRRSTATVTAKTAGSGIPSVWVSRPIGESGRQVFAPEITPNCKPACAFTFNPAFGSTISARRYRSRSSSRKTAASECAASNAVSSWWSEVSRLGLLSGTAGPLAVSGGTASARNARLKT